MEVIISIGIWSLLLLTILQYSYQYRATLNHLQQTRTSSVQLSTALEEALATSWKELPSHEIFPGLKLVKLASDNVLYRYED